MTTAPDSSAGMTVVLHHLRAGGHVKQHLTAHRHLIVFRIEQNLPDQFTDGGRPRIAYQQHARTRCFKNLLEQLRLRAFTAALHRRRIR